jgi:dihydrofolate synthase / folylpolyglutamate synthase
VTDLILERLTRLYPRAIDLGLDRIERLLAEIGSPHKKLPPVVHVAGTNGKGSLVAYLRAMSSIPRRIWCASTSAFGWPGG